MPIQRFLDTISGMRRVHFPAAMVRATREVGPYFADLLRAGRLSPDFQDSLPIPGLYAVLSGAGGGKSTFCRELDAAAEQIFSSTSATISFDLLRCGEPEDPTSYFEKVFHHIVKDVIGQRDPNDSGLDPLILIVDSLTDLSFQELPRQTKDVDGETQTDEHSFVIPGDRDSVASVLDLALSHPEQYFSPNTAALSGGLTGSYYQLLKKISMACTARGVYLIAVINPLTFDDGNKFRNSVSGSCAAAVSIDTSNAGLARCVKLTESGNDLDPKTFSRRPIGNTRVSATSDDVSNLYESILLGGASNA